MARTPRRRCFYSPAPDGSPVPSFKGDPLIDGLPARILAYEMAGRITRTQAHLIVQGKITLRDAIKVHAETHDILGVKIVRITQKAFRNADRVNTLHTIFRVELRSFERHVQKAFSTGKITLLQARLVHKLHLNTDELDDCIGGNWDVYAVSKSTKKTIDYRSAADPFESARLPAHAAEHPHSSGGIAFV